jgi:hypothetical protein
LEQAGQIESSIQGQPEMVGRVDQLLREKSDIFEAISDILDGLQKRV